jgi:hypothetical protein
MAEQPAEVLQVRGIHEHQAVERGGSRPHPEQHAARRSTDRRRHVGVGIVGEREAVRGVKQHHAVDARPTAWRARWQPRFPCEPDRAQATTARASTGDPMVTSHRLRKT